MFAQVIVGLDSRRPAAPDPLGSCPEYLPRGRNTPGSVVSANRLTLMRVVIVGFLTVIIGHAR
jgi:hypothetical protein